MLRKISFGRCNYVTEKYRLLIIDLATLTGAIVVALGSEYAGLFGIVTNIK